MDRADAVDDFANAAGELARRQLPLAAEVQQALAHAGNDDRLYADDASGGDHSEPEILHDDEGERRDRLAAKKGRGDEGIAGEAAHRLHLVLDHGGDFGRFYPLEVDGRKTQHPVDQLEADTAQHALAEPL